MVGIGEIKPDSGDEIIDLTGKYLMPRSFPCGRKTAKKTAQSRHAFKSCAFLGGHTRVYIENVSFENLITHGGLVYGIRKYESRL